MNFDSYHPIRQKAFWVAVIQAVVTLAAYLGVSIADTEPIATAAIAVLNVLVLAGILGKGVVDAEENTAPLDDTGRPLNPDYAILEHGETPPDYGSLSYSAPPDPQR